MDKRRRTGKRRTSDFSAMISESISLSQASNDNSGM